MFFGRHEQRLPDRAGHDNTGQLYGYDIISDSLLAVATRSGRDDQGPLGLTQASVKAWTAIRHDLLPVCVQRRDFPGRAANGQPGDRRHHPNRSARIQLPGWDPAGCGSCLRAGLRSDRIVPGQPATRGYGRHPLQSDHQRKWRDGSLPLRRHLGSIASGIDAELHDGAAIRHSDRVRPVLLHGESHRRSGLLG